MTGNPQIFGAAALDPYAERITTGIALVGGILTLPTLFWYLSGLLRYQIGVPGIVISSAVALAMIVWLMLNYAVQPIEYSIADDKLVIRRRWARQVRLKLEDITGASTATALADVPRMGLRRSFNAGVFGYHGPFELEPYGRVFFAATNRQRLVALARRNGPPLIVSPDRPRDFVAAVREALLDRLKAPAEPAAERVS
jgi:hypothetical protein